MKKILKRRNVLQHPLYGAWQVKNSPSSPCHLTVSGSGCIDLDYKIMEDLRGVKYPITSSSPVLGKHISEYTHAAFACFKNVWLHTRI